MDHRHHYFTRSVQRRYHRRWLLAAALAAAGSAAAWGAYSYWASRPVSVDVLLLQGVYAQGMADGAARAGALCKRGEL